MPKKRKQNVINVSGLSKMCSGYYLKNKMSRKLRIKDNRDITYSCDLCDKIFATKGNVRTHIKVVHMDPIKFSCTHCDKKFEVQQNLLTHIQSSHEDLTYKCNQCDKRFSLSNNLRRHRLSKQVTAVCITTPLPFGGAAVTAVVCLVWLSGSHAAGRREAAGTAVESSAVCFYAQIGHYVRQMASPLYIIQDYMFIYVKMTMKYLYYIIIQNMHRLEREN